MYLCIAFIDCCQLAIIVSIAKDVCKSGQSKPSTFDQFGLDREMQVAQLPVFFGAQNAMQVRFAYPELKPKIHILNTILQVNKI